MTAADQSGRTRDVELVLSRSALFAGVDHETIAALAATATRRVWESGAVLFQRGDSGTFMLALVSGRVRLSVSTPTGKELVLRHMGPGEVLGEFSLIDGEPRSADATAVETCSAVLLHRDQFLQAAGRYPQIGLALARHLCRQLRSTNYQMESIALYDLRSRVARFLLLAVQGHGESRHARLRMKLNQSELALVLGASRPKINQVLQAMMAEGLVERDGDVLVCDVARIAEAAEVAGPEGAA